MRKIILYLFVVGVFSVTSWGAFAQASSVPQVAPNQQTTTYMSSDSGHHGYYRDDDDGYHHHHDDDDDDYCPCW